MRDEINRHNFDHVYNLVNIWFLDMVQSSYTVRFPIHRLDQRHQEERPMFADFQLTDASLHDMPHPATISAMKSVYGKLPG